MIRPANIYDIPRINELGELLHDNFSSVYSINEMLEDGISKVIVYEKDDRIMLKKGRKHGYEKKKLFYWTIWWSNNCY